MSNGDTELMTTEKYGVGQSVNRKEDPTLLVGAGRFTDDVKWDNQLVGKPAALF